MDSSILPSPAADPALYANRSRDFIGGGIALIALPTLAVVLRLLSRWFAGAGFWV